MSSIALHPDRRDFDLCRVPLPALSPPTACRPRSIFGRILAAIARSQRRRVEQEAGRFIADHGARLTDDIERQLTAHFNGRGFLPDPAQRPFRPFIDQ